MTEKDKLLFQAICYGNLELCKEQIAQGADVKAKDRDGTSVLHIRHHPGTGFSPF